MKRFLLTFFAAIISCLVFPTLSRAETTITWNASVLAGCNIRYNSYLPNSFSNGGITVTINHDGDTEDYDDSGYISFSTFLYEDDPQIGEMYTFSCATANITRIEISCAGTPDDEAIVADGWSVASPGVVWSGTPASSVDFGAFVTHVTQIVFTIDAEGSGGGGGESDYVMLSGVFSVSDSKTVHFSRGNLQYQASTDTWRFAEHQYDVISDNAGNTTYKYDRETQSDWIDLFGWGTGDEPWKSASNRYDYSSYTEWGSQFDTESGWHTLTNAEWNYLLFGRYDYEHPGVSYAKGRVNGINGLIILPDDWSTSNYDLNNTNDYESHFYENVISLDDWTTYLEANGAIFLPSTGYRYDCYVNETNNGYYWTSTQDDDAVYSFSFENADMGFHSAMNQPTGHAVRLVAEGSAAPSLPEASITAIPTAIHGLEYNGSWQTLITAGTTEDGEMQYSTDNIDWSSSLPTGKNAGVYTIYYKVVGDAEHSDYTPARNQLNVSIADDSEWDGNLSTTTANKRAKNGTVITGTLDANVKISVVSGATVTLKDATISGSDNALYRWSGITCEGDATIIVEGDNTVTGFHWGAGISVPVGSTLTIDGIGSLTATGGYSSAGIGSGTNSVNQDCGNIIINGGVITASGHGGGAGIGTAYNNCSCGDITINGGIITAIGSNEAAGIGTGHVNCSCGNITINEGSIIATGGSYGAGIGTGSNGCTCGDITITGGEIVASTGSNYAAGIGAGYYNCVCGNIVISGGDIESAGGQNGAGIGSAYESVCGDITITRGHIVATRGNSEAQPIGEAWYGPCGTVSVADYLTDDHDTPTRTINGEYASLVSEPTAIDHLVYDGSAVTLVNAGSAEHGTMRYSIDNIHWSADLPTATHAGNYTVYYKVKGGVAYNDYIPSSNTLAVKVGGAYYETDADIETSLAALPASIDIILHRTIYKDGYYNTICLPVDMSSAEIAASDLAGCELFAFDDASVSGSVLDLYISPASAIVAGVPYLIKWPNTSAEAQDITLSFSDVTIGATTGASVGGGSVQFVGTIGRTELPVDEDYLFVGANNTLHWSNNDGTIMKAFRAYFIVGSDPVISPRQTPARLVVRPKAPTALESIENSEFSIQKFIRNGQLIIIRGDKEYDAQGQVVK